MSYHDIPEVIEGKILTYLDLKMLNCWNIVLHNRFKNYLKAKQKKHLRKKCIEAFYIPKYIPRNCVVFNCPQSTIEYINTTVLHSKRLHYCSMCVINMFLNKKHKLYQMYVPLMDIA